MKCIEEYEINGKLITLYKADAEDRPLAILNNFEGNGKSVIDEIEKLSSEEYNIACISNLDWNHDMTPWHSESISANDSPFTGGADDYLDLLIKEIIPSVKDLINGKPFHIGIAGYSLGGLFAIYAMHNCDAFDRAASMSGSLWFSNFTDYIKNHDFMKMPERIYISLGDREAKTRHPILSTVQGCTEEIVSYYREIGLDVIWELNKGNHFKNPSLRTAKGLLSILED